MNSKKRILILIKEKQSDSDKNWEFFRSTVQTALGEDIEITMGELTSLTFESDGLDSKVYDRDRGWSLDEFDLVVFRLIRKEFATASACASFLIAKNIPYIDTETQPGGRSKYAAGVLRQSVGLSTIPTVHGSHTTLSKMIEREELPFAYPIVIKDNFGKKGRLNFIAHNKAAALQIMRENEEVDFIIQSFIQNEGDYRILVFGGTPVLVIYRQAQGSSHLNNTSQGAVASIVPLSEVDPTILEDAKRAADVEHLEVAGVDIVTNHLNGQHYVIETNSSPQIASGAFPDLKTRAYADYLTSLVKRS